MGFFGAKVAEADAAAGLDAEAGAVQAVAAAAAGDVAAGIENGKKIRR